MEDKIPQLFNFEKHKPILEMPDLLDLQKKSFRDFMDLGLRAIFQEIFPIRDQNYVLEYVSHDFQTPKYDVQECKDKGFNYGGVLKLQARLLVKDTGEAKEGVVVIGELPKMTPTGSFVINGTERVVVSQLIRSPGVYFPPPPEKTTNVRGFTCTVIPDRGTWLEFELEEGILTREGGIFVKVDKRSKKIPVTILLKALGYSSNQELAFLLRQFQMRSVSLTEIVIPRSTLDLEARKQLTTKLQGIRQKALDASAGEEGASLDFAETIHRWLKSLPRKEIDLRGDTALRNAGKRFQEKLLLQFSRPEKLISEALSELTGKSLADSIQDPRYARLLAETVRDPNTGMAIAESGAVLSQRLLQQLRQSGLEEVSLVVPLRSQLEGYLKELTLAETVKDPISSRILAKEGDILTEPVLFSMNKLEAVAMRLSMAPGMDSFLREGTLAERGKTLGEKALYQLFLAGTDWLLLDLPLVKGEIPYLAGKVLAEDVINPRGGETVAKKGETLTEEELNRLAKAGVEHLEVGVSLHLMLDRFLAELSARLAGNVVDANNKLVGTKGQLLDGTLIRVLLASGVEPISLAFALPAEMRAFLEKNTGAILEEDLADPQSGNLLLPAGSVLDEPAWLKVLLSGPPRCRVLEAPLPLEVRGALQELTGKILTEPVSDPSSGEVLAECGQMLSGERLLLALIAGVKRFQVVEEPLPAETVNFLKGLEGAVLADSVIDPSSNSVLAESGEALDKNLLLRLALAGVEDLEIVENVLDPDLESTFKRDSSASQDEAQIELYKRLHPGEPPTRDSARALVKNLFLDPKRNDLGAVGRYKLNKKLHPSQANHPALGDRTIAKEDILEIVRYFLGLKSGASGSGYYLDATVRALLLEEFRPMPGEMICTFLCYEQEGETARVSLDPGAGRYLRDQDRFRLNRLGEYFQDSLTRRFFLKKNLVPFQKGYGILLAQQLVMLPPRDCDEIDHLGNRRVRTVGELLQNQLRMGFVRMERNIRDRMTTVAPEEADPKALINPRPVVAAIREFFGSSQLSQFMDETNPLSALTHKRRLSSLGPGGLNRERAGVEVRDIHYSHYGRVCPIETPEGPNIGLINSLTNYGQVNEYGFLVTPYRKVIEGRVTEEIVYLTADEEEKLRISETNVSLGENPEILGEAAKAEEHQLNSDLALNEECRSAVDKQIAGYVAEINATEKTISGLNGNLSTAQNDIKTKTTEVASLEPPAGSSEAEQTLSILKTNQPKIKKLKADIQKAEKMAKELSSSIDEKNKILENLNEEKAKSDSDKAKLEGELSTLNIQTKDNQTEIALLEKDNQTEIALLEKIKKLKGDIQKDEEEAKELSSRLDEKNKVLESLNEEKAKLESEKLKLEGDLSALKMQIKENQTEVASLQPPAGSSEAEQTPSILKTNQPKIKKLKADIQKAEKMAKELSSGIDNKQKELDKLEEEKTKLDSEKVKLEGELSALNIQTKDKQTEIASLQPPAGSSEAEQTPSILKTNQPKIKKLKADIQKAEKEAKELSSRLDEKNNDLAKLEEEKTKLDSEKVKLEGELSALKMQIKENQTEVASLQPPAGSSEAEQTLSILKTNQPKIKKLKADIQKAEKMAKELSSSIDEKNKILENLNEEKAKSDSDKAKLEGELSTLEMQIKESKEKQQPKIDARDVLVRHGEVFETVLPSQVDLMDISPRQVFSISASLIPFLEHDDPIRALMGCNMQRQAVPLLKPELPLVATGLEPRVAIDSGEVIVAEHKGLVRSVTADRIEIQTERSVDRYPLKKYNRSNRATCINQRPIVRKGQKVEVGAPLADGAATSQGELSLGANVLVAFLPWAGYNYEDAIVLSERMVRDDVYTSIHIEEYEVAARDTKLGPEEITHEVPNVSEDMLRNLDEEGVIRIGAEVRAGDILVGKITPKGETELSPEERLLRAIFGEKAREVRDTSLRVPHGEKGTVVGVKVFSKEAGDELQTGVLKKVKVFVAQKRKVMEGDKMSGRHGNKGVVSIVVPQADMPFLPDGRPVDVVLNPLGVPSRMNIGQILELHLGWAGETEGKRYYTPVFSGASEADVIEKLREAGLPETGKTVLFDGRTGEPFDREVAVGVMYMMKLIHMVEDKLHARSIGPYSLVTQQPLGGKAQFGGQRFGEMEVWALEGYGAASVLQEMLTVKSDDISGRIKTYESIVKGKDALAYSLPESFKVLMKELQGLCLDFKLISEKAGEITLKESDEDLRKKADEIDLILNVHPEKDSNARNDE
ncbi:MAG: DNA-directed RNA polymerase subunit beta [Coprothermobacterota bacterium]|nr:DNA-directed RNA polymerase subunit beta [Coprothermobacterota bacterium]